MNLGNIQVFSKVILDYTLIISILLLLAFMLVLKPSKNIKKAMDKSPNSPKTYKFRTKLHKILGSGSFKTRSTPASPITEKPSNKFRFEANSLDSLEVLDTEAYRPKSYSTSSVKPCEKSPTTVRKSKSLR
ncbi:hypothetical protein HHI36_014011 [Cryptolaemus montrouzieri]|uniref:ATP synthase F0 subunit 8 n=1 Tax=Cryptolaemus montrouzieri TaxID=559131 RepID=A0ABD2N1Y9_9CUCU